MAEVRVFIVISIIFFTMLMLAAPVECDVQSEKDYVLVDSKPSLPLTVDGVEAFPPIKVRLGSEVCVSKTTLYVDVDRRYVFDKWSSGEFSRCVRASENITAYYVEEVLVQVYSREVREYFRSFWVKVGELVKLKVEPIHYVSGDTRYVFEEWSDGEMPLSPENIIAAVKPVRVQVKWVKQYLLTLTSSERVNGSGWYREGSTAIISAPEFVDNGDTRKIFEKWVSVGLYPAIINNPKSPTTHVTVNAPYQITPVYQEFFLVEVHGLGGLIDRRWVEKGGLYNVEVKNVIEVVPGEVRYVFRGWSDKSIPQIPSIQIEVDKPLKLEALYEKQYYIKVYSDYGSVGEGWYKENSTAIVRVSETPQTILFMKRVLKGWGSDADAAEINGGVAIVRNINKPVKLSVVYGLEVDYLILIIFSGVVGFLIFIGLWRKEKGKFV